MKKALKVIIVSIFLTATFINISYAKLLMKNHIIHDVD
ncbi:hypothetical protein Deia_00790 [Candidatus Deianiraea vastatrix]|uniref:Uncharacterized protein n=1 Tax=Candidatus Deianiraea vastatrix TaxID=2163644 RepID=A0A5B8XE41_9RICK|nr:hypothetical protein Deia_00790 [Candidatus Deianiraea vastatrix]